MNHTGVGVPCLICAAQEPPVLIPWPAVAQVDETNKRDRDFVLASYALAGLRFADEESAARALEQAVWLIGEIRKEGSP